jgi:CHAT domain-containing protein/cytochrome c-type biogenesis protein CcmH/NrfG
MAHENDEEGLIRRYLLGRLVEDELLRVEEKIMADTEFFNLVLLAEDEIVEEYVEGELPESDRADFKASFESTPEGRLQVSLAKALSQRDKPVPAEHGEPYQKKESITSDPEAGVRSFAAGASAGVPVEKEQLSAKPQRERSVSRQVWWSRPAVVPYFGLAAAAVFVVAIAVGAVWFVGVREDPVAEGRAALIALYSNQRPTHSRLSGFKHAPFIELMGNDDATRPDRVERDRAGLLVQNAANQNPKDYEAIHLLGQYYLSIGDFDQAIAQLRKAHELAPNNPKILSDLGGALFEKTRNEGLSSANNAELDECLRSLNRAIEISPSLAEAYFNRALCNELLMQWESAEADWRQYLQLDSTSPWAAEAREGLQRIEEQKRRSEWDEPRLFNDFIEAAATQNKDAGWRALSISIGTRSSHIVDRLIGESLGGSDHQTVLKWAGEIALAETGDPLIADIAQRYGTSSRAELAELQEARRRFSKGVVLFREWKLRDAGRAFEEAAQQFEMLGDPAEAIYARYLQAHCYLRLPELEAARTLFNEVRKTAQAKEYKWLESRAYDGLADLHFTRSEYSRAIEFARRSLELSRELSNAACNARSCFQLAEIYLQLGDFDEAGKFAWEGLQGVNREPVDPLQSSLPYEAAADLFTAARLDGLAMAFQLEALKRANIAGHPVKISFAHAHVSRLYAALNDQGRAIEQLERAAETAATLPESEASDVRAFASLCSAHLQRRGGDLDRAISSYEEALGTYVQSGRHNLAFAARMGKLLCHIKRRDVDAAKAEMLSIRNLIEEFTSEIVEEKNRILFTEGLNEFHNAAIEFAYSTLGDGTLAYEYAEMFRARSLYDLATGPWETTGDREGLKVAARSAPLTPADITEQLPSNAQLVQYAVLDDKSLAWVVSGREVHTREIPVAEGELKDRVKRFVELCRRPEVVDVTAEATALYEILIQPIELLLDRDKQLFIVPDNVLSGLPFAALKSPRTKRYLIESFVISSAPSSSLFVKCTDWGRRKRSTTAERVLSVGDPEFDQGRFKLNRLPDAAWSASAIAALYPTRTTLIGPRAGERAVTTAMSQADVINLATHYLIDDRSPMLSKLLLSADGASSSSQATDGALQGYELYGLRLPRARLVVLSGCQTMGDAFFNFEGAVGAARPFISAGVPLVAATLWPVDSKATSELIFEFHKQRRPGVTSSAEALQAAQLKLIRSGDYKQGPFYWAGVSLIGGHADF